MSDDNVIRIGKQAEPEQEKTPDRDLTRGERLVGYTFNPSGDFAVKLAKHRAARTIDALLNHPIALRDNILDIDHRGIIEEAIRRQIDAQMWAVKALTWGK